MPTLKKVAVFCTLLSLVGVLEYFLLYLFYMSVTSNDEMITVELQRSTFGLISRKNWNIVKDSVNVSIPEVPQPTSQIATVISELQSIENISATSMISYAESNESEEMKLPFTELKVDNLEGNPYFNDRIRQLLKKYPHLNGQILSSLSQFACVEPLVECSNRIPRNLTTTEARGDSILFTLRTTLHFHHTRLPVLFDTWLSTANGSNVFIMTDGNDKTLEETARSKGMHYVISKKSSYQRGDLCCKAGTELEELFYPGNEHYDWLCHVDDDIYVNLPALVRSLAKFDPKTEPVYYGRSGSKWESPRRVLQEGKIGKAGQPYHFAVGGMYCLSRPMLEKAKPYLVGCEAFTDSCNKTQEPEDVTVGLVVGIALKQQLQRTEMIYTHGLDLPSTVPAISLEHQVGFSYGYGAVKPWSDSPNVVLIPHPLFTIEEDESQFRSLHCHLHPTVDWCVKKKEQNEAVIIERRRQVMKNFQGHVKFRSVPPVNVEAGGNHPNNMSQIM